MLPVNQPKALPSDFEPHTSGDVVDFEVTDSIATITLNRPDKLNSASVELLYTVTERLYEIKARDDIGAVILTGAGEAFCSGFDLLEIPLDDGQQAVHEHFRRAALYWHDMIPAIVRLNKPVVAAVNGRAVGGGLGMTLASDIAFAAESANFTPAFMAFGVGPDSTTTYHLPRIMGFGRHWSGYTRTKPSTPTAPLNGMSSTALSTTTNYSTRQETSRHNSRRAQQSSTLQRNTTCT